MQPHPRNLGLSNDPTSSLSCPPSLYPQLEKTVIHRPREWARAPLFIKTLPGYRSSSHSVSFFPLYPQILSTHGHSKHSQSKHDIGWDHLPFILGQLQGNFKTPFTIIRAPLICPLFPSSMHLRTQPKLSHGGSPGSSPLSIPPSQAHS